MRDIRVVAGFALRESLRRRVFVIVAVLTVAFLALYAVGAWQAFESVEEAPVPGPVETDVIAGATMLGLAGFATLFLGTVLAVFLTHGVVRGDAERGVLQPVLVRPVGRSSLLAARFAAAAAVGSAYVIVVFCASAGITLAAGGWWPDRLVEPALALALSVTIIAAISLTGSIALSATANGIAVLMVFGAGLVAGLLGQIGQALASETLDRVSTIATWLLPFEALYQSALFGLTADSTGVTRFVINLGPFGGAQEGGALLWLWSLAYLGGVAVLARVAFARKDL